MSDRATKDIEGIADGAAWEAFCESLRRSGHAVLEAAPDDAFDRAEGLRYVSRLARHFLRATLEEADPATAVLSSSTSQLFIKAATTKKSVIRSIILLGISAALMLCSILLAVVVLRTLNLSQLISFAACAYVLVPLGGRIVFGERLLPRFWVGTTLIVVGIFIANF